jgi:fermentation-respiration switch protein FrsA (DUF1100 family)
VMLMAGLWLGLEPLINSQVFFPQERLDGGPADYGLAHDELWLETADGTRLHAWHIPAPGARALLLYCHGNAGNISHRLDRVTRLHRQGVSVFIFDYRGFGRSQGRPSEQGLYQDAQAAHAQARALAQTQGQRLVLLGRSLGGVAAVWLAAHNPVDGVILESTFTNLGAMARTIYPLPGLESLLGGRFDSLGRMGQIKAPLLVVHGDRDRLVPLSLGQKLYDAAPGVKDFYLIQGAGHNDTFLVGGAAYFQRVTAFLDSLP